MKNDHMEVIEEILDRNGGQNPYGRLIDAYRQELRGVFQTSYRLSELMTLPLPVEFLRRVRATRDAGIAEIESALRDPVRGPQQMKPACRTGCHFCCFQHVSVSTVELAFIMDHLVEEPGERERITARAARLAPQISRMNRADRFSAGVPCAALGPGGLCTMYEARPQTCRTYFSYSRTACEVGWNKRRRLDTARSVPIAGEPQVFGHTIQSGIEAAFSEAGFEVELVEMTEALALAAEHPGGLAGTLAGFLAGERQFGTIATRDPLPLAEVLKLEVRAYG
jgi:Fe-S-cluster containining protein